MTTQRHVIVGFDGSPTATRALDLAAREAELRGSALDIVYAVPDRDEAEPVLAAAVDRARRRHPGLLTLPLPLIGDPVTVLLRCAGTAALTVVGARAPGGQPAWPWRSVGARLAYGGTARGNRGRGRVAGPVLIVRGDPGPARVHGDVLLIAADGADAEAALHAFEEAARRGAPLRVLPPSLHSAAALVEVTRTAAVAVLPVHRSGARRGRLTRALLHGAHCPVLLVPVPPPPRGASPTA
ncbi:universal stress protein [Streptomyces sp. PT12]|uniref:universal stress protein n=1 Tax=Streptomyces sp. PT12 TaxID=1510197 RepID=UPI000DE41990|nr:universal stress protein [Streptomyces sp. PT12]RBM19726.1 stress-inducible protein [Streptomyces sp. PT12]